MTKEKVIYVCGTCGRHKEGLKEWLVMDCNRCHRQMLPVKKEEKLEYEGRTI